MVPLMSIKLTFSENMSMCSKCLKSIVLLNSDSESSAVQFLGGIDFTKSRRATLKVQNNKFKEMPHYIDEYPTYSKIIACNCIQES